MSPRLQAGAHVALSHERLRFVARDDGPIAEPSAKVESGLWFLALTLDEISKRRRQPRASAPPLLRTIPQGRPGAVGRLGAAINPSRCAFLHAAFLALRIASPFSLTRFSEGFSNDRRRFISRNRPSRWSFFFRTLSA